MIIYTNQLKTKTQHIGKDPKLRIHRPELGNSIYSVVSGMHILFCTLNPDFITILKIIYGYRDIIKEFPLDNEN
jgi:plasmid stabilization system protein ParE